jgi:hypothetical protein
MRKGILHKWEPKNRGSDVLDKIDFKLKMVKRHKDIMIKGLVYKKDYIYIIYILYIYSQQ